MNDPFERFPDRLDVMHQCHAHIVRTRIGPIAPGLSQVRTRYDLDAETFP